jgi:hypothetical protein
VRFYDGATDPTSHASPLREIAILPLFAVGTYRRAWGLELLNSISNLVFIQRSKAGILTFGTGLLVSTHERGFQDLAGVNRLQCQRRVHRWWRQEP